MFDKIIEFIIRFWKDLLPFVIIEHWNEALILRFGKFKKLIKPGIHFKIPFFDSVWETIVITQSIDMNPQSITTADGKNIVVKAIIRYKVDDIKAYLTTISQPQDVLIDTTQGIIREIIEDTHWHNIYELDSILTKKVSGFVKRWGIKVEKVTLTDLAQIQSIRIIQNKEEKQNIFPFTENIN